MELPLTLTPNHSATTSFSAALAHCSSKLCDFQPRRKRMMSLDATRISLRCVKASAEQSGERIEEGENRVRFTGPAMEVTTLNRTFNDADFSVWEKIGAVVRLSYGLGIYGAVAVAGSFICSISGIDSMGGFQLSIDAVFEGLGYAAPPIMSLLFILDDEIVKLSPHARAIRDIDDEEL